MDVAVRIPIRFSEVLSGDRRLPVGELHLGGVPRGAVLLLCERGDLEHAAAEFMNRLAEHGYESLACDLSPAGLDEDVLVHDVRSLLDRLAERGWAHEQVGLLGYGSGGRVALLVAAELVLGAVVSVEPSGVVAPAGSAACPLEATPPSVRTPWLGMFGTSDGATPRTAVERLGAQLRANSPVFTQVVAYDGVSGVIYRDAREGVAHAASFDSWQRVLEWLNVRVVPRPTPLAEAWRRRRAG